MPGEKYYNAERERQRKFLESEKKLKDNYKKVTKEESDYEYLNSLFREDSTREYNPVEHYKRGGKIKTKKAFMGLAVEALKGGKGLGPLIGIGADKLLKKSQTARDVTGKLGVGGKLISNYYNDKEFDKRNAQAPKEEVTFDRLKKGGIAKGCGKVMSDRRKVTKMY